MGVRFVIYFVGHARQFVMMPSFGCVSESGQQNILQCSRKALTSSIGAMYCESTVPVACSCMVLRLAKCIFFLYPLIAIALEVCDRKNEDEGEVGERRGRGARGTGARSGATRREMSQARERRGEELGLRI